MTMRLAITDFNWIWPTSRTGDTAQLDLARNQETLHVSKKDRLEM